MSNRPLIRSAGALVVLLALGGSLGACSNTNTAATRALDKAAGTDTSGAYPAQRDGTRANPPGTAASRAYDRATDSDTSGAYPQNTVRQRTGY